MALTNNVVNGRVGDAPVATNALVPAWIRKILLRGLRVNPDERFPSMGDLLDALGKDPAVAQRRWLVATGALLLAGGLGFGVQKGLAESTPACGGGPEKLAGIWEIAAPGRPETPRHASLHAAFLKTGKSYAKDVWATTSRALTKYAHAWTDMYRETCEATAVHKVQSEEVMDLRMTCLNERLGGLRALTDVFSEATGEVVENAVSAANALASLDRCADVPVLRAVVKPPEDAATKAKVNELRKKVADLKARFDAGRYKAALSEAPNVVSDARSVGYQPLVAEALLLKGTIAYKSNNTRDAEENLVEAYLLADESRHDEIRAESAAGLVWVVGYQDGRVAEAKRWAKIASSVLHRLGGHELLHAWLLNDLGAVSALAGDAQAMLRAQIEARSIKEKVLGATHPDVGFSDANIAFALQELGRSAEALTHIDRSLSIIKTGLGTGHPDYAMALSNRGEVLNALGRHAEAREAFEKARDIWERELGPADRNLGYALTGLGVSYLGEGNSRDAVVVLERANKIRQDSEKDALRRAETKFAFARALWESKGDRRRARALADEAKREYSKGPDKTKQVEVETWLQDRSAS
jgi:eukaryotic-like serine/threonine-protein kinase